MRNYHQLVLYSEPINKENVEILAVNITTMYVIPEL